MWSTWLVFHNPALIKHSYEGFYLHRLSQVMLWLNLLFDHNCGTFIFNPCICAFNWKVIPKYPRYQLALALLHPNLPRSHRPSVALNSCDRKGVAAVVSSKRTHFFRTISFAGDQDACWEECPPFPFHETGPVSARGFQSTFHILVTDILVDIIVVWCVLLWLRVSLPNIYCCCAVSYNSCRKIVSINLVNFFHRSVFYNCISIILMSSCKKKSQRLLWNFQVINLFNKKKPSTTSFIF